MQSKTRLEAILKVTGIAALFIVVLFLTRELLGQVLDPMTTQFVAEIIIVTLVVLANRFWWHVRLSYKPVAVKKMWHIGWIGWGMVILDGGEAIAAMIINPNLSATFMATIMVVMVGFYEETLFRGVILSTLVSAFSGRGRFIFSALISSVLFGLSHGGHFFDNFGQSVSYTWLQIGYAICIGVYFSAVTLRTKSLVWTILFHACFDLPGMFLMFSRSHNGAISATGGDLRLTIIINTVVFVPVMLVGFWLMRPSKLND